MDNRSRDEKVRDELKAFAEISDDQRVAKAKVTADAIIKIHETDNNGEPVDRNDNESKKIRKSIEELCKKLDDRSLLCLAFYVIQKELNALNERQEKTASLLRLT